MDKKENVLCMMLAWSLVLSFTFNIAAARDCVKVNDCSCQMDDGSGLVDIATLGRTDGKPAFSGLDPNSVKYSYNPCYPFTDGACENVAACQNLQNQNIPIGKQDGSLWNVDPASNELIVTYTQNTTGQEQVTIVTLVCNKTITDTADYIAIGTVTGNAPYFLSISHKCACPGLCTPGLSAGTVIIIVFFCVLAVYLIGGVLYTKFVKKSTGMELIPNLDLWKTFFQLIKDGFMFLVGKCKRSQYDKI
ncbi:uncharacterized protein LOC106151379 [Lingula anatina]|uniref:Uncharacterized protein LOC106151379 n=1 Tax=Lingula anatina TaxID=7574 RepID=A0A1S3H4J9_LINAN|nr:uncharacterized protein LOC106151379 [Lingula anatina]|eukprot:XP_013380064.1 uncharacterized protein LOC106151379 [Lingula anatina]